MTTTTGLFKLYSTGTSIADQLRLTIILPAYVLCLRFMARAVWHVHASKRQYGSDTSMGAHTRTVVVAPDCTAAGQKALTASSRKGVNLARRRSSLPRNSCLPKTRCGPPELALPNEGQGRSGWVRSRSSLCTRHFCVSVQPTCFTLRHMSPLSCRLVTRPATGLLKKALLLVCLAAGFHFLPSFTPVSLFIKLSGAQLPSYGASDQSSWQAYLLDTDYGGVRRYAIPGTFPKSNFSEGDGLVNGVLQIFLKAGIWEGHYHIRGFVVFEFNELPPHYKSRRIWPLLFGNVPEVHIFCRLSVRSNVEGWEKPVPLRMQFCAGMWNAPGPQPSESFHACVRGMSDPKREHHRLPFSQIDFDMGPLNSTDVDLLVEGWPRTTSLATLLDEAQAMPLDAAPTLPASGPLVVQHIPYAYKIEPSRVAQLMSWRAEHMSDAGVAATFLYVQPRHAAALASNPLIQSLVMNNKLRLVVWQELALWVGEPYYEQVVQIAHSVLSFWGTPAQVLVMDFDEFVVTKGDLGTVLSTPGCVSYQPGCATFHRYDVLPSSAPGVEQLESVAWATPGPSPFKTLYARPVVAVTRVHKHNPKTIVDPNAAFVPSGAHTTSGCGARSPALCTEPFPCGNVSRDCAWIAHFWSMFEPRKPRSNTSFVELGAGWLHMENQPQFWLSEETM